MRRVATLLASVLVLSACGGAGEQRPARVEPDRRVPAAPASTSATDDAAARPVVGAGTPEAEPPLAPACEVGPPLPGLDVENAAWVADVAGNIAYGLQALSCAAMTREQGPDDLLGRAAFVACGPPRFCSAGPDGRRGSADDACAPLREAHSDAPRTMPVGYVRRFLTIGPDMRPGCASADAAVAHFFASFLRGDDAYRAVLPPASEWDEGLRGQMDEYARYTIRAARLQGLRCLGDACEFEVYLSVSARGSTSASGGVDHGMAERRGDRWIITRPPS